MQLEMQFLGGAGEVGRSGFVIKDKKNILLDYGIKLDGKTEYPLPCSNIDFFVLSHAHLDHSGDAPSLYHSQLPVAFGTEPTLELSQLLIEDSMKLNKKRHTKPRFTKGDNRNFVNRYVPYAYNSVIDTEDYEISLYDAGHICGSAITQIKKKGTGKRLVYTGDFKLSPQLLQKGADVVESDILIIETTYATREHPERENLVKLFVDGIKEVTENNGIALVPVFAVGRAQEVIAILEKNGLIENTYLDGMSKKATDIVLHHKDFINNADLLTNAMQDIIKVHKSYQRQEALQGGNIIVTTAGMLNGGPVLDYITKLNKSSMIFLTGYQAEDTNGRKLLDGKPLTIDKQSVYIKTPFSFYDLSAHAGNEDLQEYVKQSSPETVICVHGDGESTNSFREWLAGEGFEAHAPTLGQKIKLEF